MLRVVLRPHAVHDLQWAENYSHAIRSRHRRHTLLHFFTKHLPVARAQSVAYSMERTTPPTTLRSAPQRNRTKQNQALALPANILEQNGEIRDFRLRATKRNSRAMRQSGESVYAKPPEAIASG